MPRLGLLFFSGSQPRRSATLCSWLALISILLELLLLSSLQGSQGHLLVGLGRVLIHLVFGSVRSWLFEAVELFLDAQEVLLRLLLQELNLLFLLLLLFILLGFFHEFRFILCGLGLYLFLLNLSAFLSSFSINLNRGFLRIWILRGPYVCFPRQSQRRLPGSFCGLIALIHLAWVYRVPFLSPLCHTCKWHIGFIDLIALRILQLFNEDS